VFLKIRKSLKSKILATNSLTAFIIGMSMVAVMYVVTLNTLISQARENLKNATMSEATNIGVKIDNKINDVKELSSNEYLINYLSGKSISVEINDYLTSHTSKDIELNTGLINLEGVVLASSDEKKIGENYKEASFFKRALSNEQSLSQSIDFEEKTITHYFFSSVKSTDGKILGIVFLTLDENYLYAGIQSTTLKDIGHFTITNSDGIITYCPTGEHTLLSMWNLLPSEQENLFTKYGSYGAKITSLDHEPARDILNNYEGPTVFEHSSPETGKSEIFSFAKAGPYPLFLGTVIERHEIAAVAFTNALIIMALCTSLIVLYLIVANIILVKLLAPLKTLQKSVDSIIKGNLNQNIQIKSNDELRDLGDTLNVLTRELRKNLVIKRLRDKAHNTDEKH